jgi:hypothetical protein
LVAGPRAASSTDDFSPTTEVSTRLMTGPVSQMHSVGRVKRRRAFRLGTGGGGGDVATAGSLGASRAACGFGWTRRYHALAQATSSRQETLRARADLWGYCDMSRRGLTVGAHRNWNDRLLAASLGRGGGGRRKAPVPGTSRATAKMTVAARITKSSNRPRRPA